MSTNFMNNLAGVGNDLLGKTSTSHTHNHDADAHSHSHGGEHGHTHEHYDTAGAYVIIKYI
jgi:urease accessory protein